MKVHRRKTYQSGADRMLLDQAWHSSTPLSRIKVGDILRVQNMDTLEAVDWMVTESAVQLSGEEARAEWSKYPFGTTTFAKKYGYFPFVLRNLEKLQEYPPDRPSPRYIPSEVRLRVWHRDGGVCKNCGATDDLEFDHIIPVAKGGSNMENNIELLCKHCNSKKRDHIQ
jgi:hypothetical protein